MMVIGSERSKLQKMVLPDWILARQRAADELLVHDRDERTVRRIALVEITPTLEWNAERDKRPWRNDREEVWVSLLRSRMSGTRSMKYDPDPEVERSPGGIDVAPTAVTPGSAAMRDKHLPEELVVLLLRADTGRSHHQDVLG
jgi:hypothetical protein